MPNATCHVFIGRKPTKAQILKRVRESVRTGHNHIECQWGENWISLALDQQWGWDGHGWIKNISAQDIARELNHV